MTPPLTSVAVDCEGLGERAASVLLRQVASGEAVTETIIGPAQLIVRASCGARRNEIIERNELS
jgi:LacI family transcriptional regulator